MTTISHHRKVTIILFVILLVLLGVVFSSFLSQGSYISRSSTTGDETPFQVDDYPPLPPKEKEGITFIPFIELDMISFILIIIIIAAFAWTGIIYYRYFKAQKQHQKKRKKRY